MNALANAPIIALWFLLAGAAGAADLKPWPGGPPPALALKEAARAWDARILPVSFVIGPDGRIRYSLIGEIRWDNEHVVSRISELLPASRN